MSLLLALAPLPLCAQPPATPASVTPPASDAAPQPELPMTTLHVYMDLIQLPVLVLDSEQERMKPIDPSFFRASLDSGPEFRPRHVRQEGDDPITLGIVLDPYSEPYAMAHIDQALAGLAPESLHPSDHITLLVMECGALTRTLRDVPANSLVLQGGVDRALQRWNEEHKLKHPPACEKRIGLWDALAFASNEISTLPGRRVLLSVSNGVDSGSKTKWDDLRQFAQGKGIAIFGYSSGHQAPGVSLSGVGGGRGSRNMSLMPNASAEGGDPFDALCQLTGGMVMHLSTDYMPKQLARFTAMLRERYILEFARPRNDEPGEHNIVVTIPKKSATAFIRPAGVTILSSNATNNEDTLPTDQSDAPEIGKRKPIKPN